MHYEFFIHNGIAGWWLSKQTNFNMNFVFSKCGWCLLSFYDPGCETVTSCMVYDRTQPADSLPHEQLVNNGTQGPKAWLVYSRKGRKGNSG